MTAPARKQSYATPSKVRSMLAAAKEAGLRVGGVEIACDGTIRILSESAAKVASAAASAYDDWKNGA